VFFVNVAFKGVSQNVSLLLATLAGRFVSVAVKGLARGSEYERREGPPSTVFVKD
jgi:hypothetical protein